MKKIVVLILILPIFHTAHSWGFYGHRKINYYAVFLLPPEMMVLYKPNISFLEEHAVDPDKRRYAIKEEAPRHYIDLDYYKEIPKDSMPRMWVKAVEFFGEEKLQEQGIVPWWVQTMLARLTQAFKDKNQSRILKLSAEIGHYIADAHVPLHAHSNYNGQKTGQRGIHGFWENRIPELVADVDWDFFIGKADYIRTPQHFIWDRVYESYAAADSVLRIEQELTQHIPADQKYAYEDRNGVVIKQYSSAFAKKYNNLMQGLIERRMRQSIYAVASYWYTAWINAGQPNLTKLTNKEFTQQEVKEFEELNISWKNSNIIGREE